MATEVQTTLKIDAGQGENTLKSLREQIKQYRKELEETSITDTKFIELQKKLRETSIQVKDAMKLGTAEVEHADGSYNKLVQTMAELNKVWRATGDEAERARIGAQILDINNQLKQLDASKGNFQRNVGNYSSALTGLNMSMSQVVRELPSLQMGLNTFVLAISNNLPILADNIARVKTEMTDMVSKGQTAPSMFSAIAKSLVSPQNALVLVIVAVQALISNWDKISKLWRDKTPQEKATEAIEAKNKAIERQNDLLKEQNTENLRRYTEELKVVAGDAEKARLALDRFNEATRENALKSATEKLEEAREAEKLAYDAYVKATTGKGLFGKLFGGDGEEELKALEDAKQAVIDYKNEVAKAENDIAKAQTDAEVQATERAKAEEERRRKELEGRYNEAQALHDIAEYYAEEYDMYWANRKVPMPDFDDYNNAIDEQMDREVEAGEKLLKKIEAQNKRKMEIAEAEAKAEREMRVNALAQMSGELASIFEEDTVAYKSFATAEAIIATYSAALKSFNQLGGWPWGIVGITSSLAAGFAQVKNIMAVDTSGNTNIGSYSAPAIVSAPAVVQEVPITRTTIDRDQEERLNANLSNQRVYVVYSDIEMAGKQVQVQRSESSF